MSIFFSFYFLQHGCPLYIYHWFTHHHHQYGHHHQQKTHSFHLFSVESSIWGITYWLWFHWLFHWCIKKPSYWYNKLCCLQSCELPLVRQDKLILHAILASTSTTITPLLTSYKTSHEIGIDGSKYYFIFVNHYTKYTWLYSMTHKLTVQTIFPQFRNLVKNKFNTKIKNLILTMMENILVSNPTFRFMRLVIIQLLPIPHNKIVCPKGIIVTLLRLISPY